MHVSKLRSAKYKTIKSKQKTKQSLIQFCKKTNCTYFIFWKSIDFWRRFIGKYHFWFRVEYLCNFCSICDFLCHFHQYWKWVWNYFSCPTSMFMKMYYFHCSHKRSISSLLRFRLSFCCLISFVKLNLWREYNQKCFEKQHYQCGCSLVRLKRVAFTKLMRKV